MHVCVDAIQPFNQLDRPAISELASSCKYVIPNALIQNTNLKISNPPPDSARPENPSELLKLHRGSRCTALEVCVCVQL